MIELGIRQILRRLGYFEGFDVYVEIHLTLELYPAAFGFLKHFAVDDFRFLKTQASSDFQSRSLGRAFVGGNAHGEHDDSVSAPLHLGTYGAAVSVLGNLFEPVGYAVGLVQLVDIDDLAPVFEGAAAYEGRRIVRVSAVLGNVVVAVVSGDGSHVILVSFVDRSYAEASFYLSGDAVSVALRIFAGVYEEAVLNRLEVAAVFDDLFHEQTRSFLKVAGRLSERAVLLKLDHLLYAVETDEGLLGGVRGLYVIYVPGNVSAFVRRNRGLNVGAGQLAYEHVHNVGNGRFPCG